MLRGFSGGEFMAKKKAGRYGVHDDKDPVGGKQGRNIITVQFNSPPTIQVPREVREKKSRSQRSGPADPKEGTVQGRAGLVIPLPGPGLEE